MSLGLNFGLSLVPFTFSAVTAQSHILVPYSKIQLEKHHVPEIYLKIMVSTTEAHTYCIDVCPTSTKALPCGPGYFGDGDEDIQCACAFSHLLARVGRCWEFPKVTVSNA